MIGGPGTGEQYGSLASASGTFCAVQEPLPHVCPLLPSAPLVILRTGDEEGPPLHPLHPRLRRLLATSSPSLSLEDGGSALPRPVTPPTSARGGVSPHTAQGSGDAARRSAKSMVCQGFIRGLRRRITELSPPRPGDLDLGEMMTVGSARLGQELLGSQTPETEGEAHGGAGERLGKGAAPPDARFLPHMGGWGCFK